MRGMHRAGALQLHCLSSVQRPQKQAVVKKASAGHCRYSERRVSGVPCSRGIVQNRKAVIAMTSQDANEGKMVSGYYFLILLISCICPSSVLILLYDSYSR
jgi:hypothetical protein